MIYFIDSVHEQPGISQEVIRTLPLIRGCNQRLNDVIEHQLVLFARSQRSHVAIFRVKKGQQLRVLSPEVLTREYDCGINR